MDVEMRKARAKILRRILNSLKVEIRQLKAQGESDTGDLDLAQQAISRFCEKLWPLSLETSRSARTSTQGQRQNRSNSSA